MAAGTSSRSDTSADSYIGSHISLISKSEIRYEGVLFDINASESSIGLRNVRSFGTEGRKKDGPQLPPSDKVYEYILFRGSDIKDLQVKSSPTVETATPLYKDPAIIESHYSQGTVTCTSSFSANDIGARQNLNSQSPQTGTGLPSSSFQGSVPLYQPSGSSGLWGFLHPPITNISSFPMPVYLQGYYGANGLQAPQRSLLQPQAMQHPVVSASLPSRTSNFTTLPQSISPPTLLPPFSTGMLNSNMMLFSQSSALESDSVTTLNSKSLGQTLPATAFSSDNSSFSPSISRPDDGIGVLNSYNSGFKPESSNAETSGSFLNKGSTPPLVTPNQLLQHGPTPIQFPPLNQNLQSGAAPNQFFQPATANQLLQSGPAVNQLLQPGTTQNQLLQPEFTTNQLLKPDPVPNQHLQPGHAQDQVLQPTTASNQHLQIDSGPNQPFPPGSTVSTQNLLLQTGPGPKPNQLLQPGSNPTQLNHPAAKLPSNYHLESTQKDVEVVQVSSIRQLLPSTTAAQPPLLPTPPNCKVNLRTSYARSNSRGARDRLRGNGVSRHVTKFTEDFDFTAMNEKFNKDEIWGHLGKSNHTQEDGHDLQDEDDSKRSKSESKPVYVKDDFFDSLSCNVSDRASRTGKINFSELRKLDVETFGTYAKHRGGIGYGHGYGGGRRNADGGHRYGSGSGGRGPVDFGHGYGGGSGRGHAGGGRGYGNGYGGRGSGYSGRFWGHHTT